MYLGEYCYNTTHHLSICMSPFKAPYGYKAATVIDLILTDSRVPSVNSVNSISYWSDFTDRTDHVMHVYPHLDSPL